MEFRENGVVYESGKEGIEFIITPAGPGEPEHETDQDKIREIGKILDKCEGRDIVHNYQTTPGKSPTQEKYIQELKFTLVYPEKAMDS